MCKDCQWHFTLFYTFYQNYAIESKLRNDWIIRKSNFVIVFSIVFLSFYETSLGDAPKRRIMAKTKCSIFTMRLRLMTPLHFFCKSDII
jgi:hypothetical protein